MVSVILNWIYICITTFVTGYGVLRFLTRHFPCAKKQMPDRPDAYVVCGLVCVTVYAQFFSLFAGVGLAANLLLCAACIVIALREREGLIRVLAGFRQQGDTRRLFWGKCCAAVALFFLFAYGTSRGMIHYDTGLYHAQSIRWIEEYGAVKGLGNLHCRLAYNSASFVLSALYSMAFLGKGSLHCVAGFLAFLLAAGCLRLIDSLRERKLYASDFARVMCVYYLVNLFDEMISPASDYFMVLIAFYLVITWLSLAESGEEEIFPYALLCVLAVFLLTVKLSAAFVLLLAIYPACRLIKEKRFRETAGYLGLGFVVTLPFFIRNVILSGWLVYPFTRIDLFDVAWKIPKGLADYDAREIQVYGRGYTDVAQFDLPMSKWLPGWFHALAGSDQVFVLAAVFAVAALVVFAVYLLRRKAADGTVFMPLFAAQGTVAACFLFWLCTSPLMRYGCVWVYLTPAVVFGCAYNALLYRGRAQTPDGQTAEKARSGDADEQGAARGGAA
ncbi:MAG: hypothetical protein NC430_09745, partial [bacterium]|nr:hypothetical protein [bacterium]